MDVTVITQLIGSLGFPIACTCVMFYMWNKEREEHKQECEQLRDAVNNNTLVMQKIIDKLKLDDEDK